MYDLLIFKLMFNCNTNYFQCKDGNAVVSW